MGNIVSAGALIRKRRAAPSSSAGLVALVGGQHHSVVEKSHRYKYCPRHQQALIDGTYCETCPLNR